VASNRTLSQTAFIAKLDGTELDDISMFTMDPLIRPGDTVTFPQNLGINDNNQIVGSFYEFGPPPPVPEPTSLILLASGMVVVLCFGKLHRNR